MGDPGSAKRVRLSMACNECRRRKVKCDAQYPKCRNCAVRNSECNTTSLKRSNVPILREWVHDTLLHHPANGASSEFHTNRSDDNSHLHYKSPSATTAASHHATTATPEEINEISPVYHPYQMSFNVDRSTNRLKMMGGSSSHCLIKSLDLYLARARVKPFLPGLQYGMQHAEEMVLPLIAPLPPLPPVEKRQAYMDTFFDTVFTVWPVVPIDETKKAIHALATSGSLENTSRDQIPLLATAYLIMSLGADESAQGITSDGDKYLQAAASIFGHVILVPYLDAVQTLVLYTIAYRGRNKDGLAWQTIGFATRIAHTLGLHKHSAIKPSSEHLITQESEQKFHARIWGICCCLEKTLQLECGRPSAIISVDNDQLMGDQRPHTGHNFLLWNMSLAGYQAEISQHIYNHKLGDRTAKDILQSTARLDSALLEWSHLMPSQFQPEHVLLCSNDHFNNAAYLSIHYHQAMIALHRAALIAPQGKFDMEVEKHCSDQPSKFRIKRGESICVGSARAIIRLSLEIVERKLESRVHAVAPILLACVALAIFLVKNPTNKGQAIDLELLKAGVDLTNDQYIKCGQDRRMIQGISSMPEKVRTYLQYMNKIHREAHANGRQRGIESQKRSAHQDLHHPNQLSLASGLTSEQPNLVAQQVSQVSAVFPSDSISRSILDKREISSDRRDIQSESVQANMTNNPEQSIPDYTSFPTDESLMLGNITDTFDPNIDLTGSAYSFFKSGGLPFDNYNMEEMWDWMLFIDSTDQMNTGSVNSNI